MYYVIKSNISIEGVKHIGYGITNRKGLVIKNLSTDYHRVLAFVWLLNKEGADEDILPYLIEDFLCEK